MTSYSVIFAEAERHDAQSPAKLPSRSHIVSVKVCTTEVTRSQNKSNTCSIFFVLFLLPHLLFIYLDPKPTDGECVLWRELATRQLCALLSDGSSRPRLNLAHETKDLTFFVKLYFEMLNQNFLKLRRC